MWEPVGPLPAGVYWRRRCVAIASTLGTVVVISWLVAALLTPARPAPVEATLAVATQTSEPPAPRSTEPQPDAAITEFVIPSAPPPAPAVAPPPPSTPAAPSAAPPPPRPVVAPGPSTTGRQGFGPTGRTGRATEAQTTELLLPDESPRRTGPAATPIALPSTGPAPCANAALAVTTEVDPQVNRVTGPAVLRLVVTNVSDQPCLRDLDAARQEIVVWGVDGARLWSSNDCSQAAGVDLRTLVPGQPAAFAVTWVGRTSAPGCRGARTTVPPGTYIVMTRVDDVISPPVPMVRTP